jgi:hypothetical protein
MKDAFDQQVDGPPSRLPVVASAVVCPGLGQAMQRRWGAAAFHALAFAAAVVVFGIRVYRILAAFYSLGFDVGAEPVGDVGVGGMLAALGILLAVYAANVADAWMAYRRVCRRWIQRRHAARTCAGASRDAVGGGCPTS